VSVPLKSEGDAPLKRLEADGARPEVLTIWRQLVAEEILPEEDEDEFM